MVLVFDLDDTLYPEREFVLSGFRAVDAWLARERGIGGFFDVARRCFERGIRGRIFDAALEERGVAAEAGLVAQMVAVYRAHDPVLSLFPDAVRALGRFRDRARLALLTDGFAATQRRKIRALGLEKLFPLIVCTDELGRAFWKPSPTGFEKIMSAFNCVPDACVYVADNPAKDFLAPNRLGWNTVRLVRPQGEHAAVDAALFPAEHAPGRTIRSLDELE